MILPDAFTQQTRLLMGDDLFARLADGLATEPTTSIRLNPAKCGMRPKEAAPVEWCGHGVYLDRRPNFTFDPLLHAGWYYVQEASSMFLHRVISQHVTKPVAMLDMCAAPGGKSTAALGALPEGSVLMSNEPVRLRAHILAENIIKWGYPATIVTNNYPRDYAHSGLSFDVILCDVPCSGEGMFRKDSDAIGEWSVQNVDNCRTLQREIVTDAWQCLRHGGLLIYSTCTFNAKENEENVEWICRELGAETMSVDTDSCWNICGSLKKDFQKPVYRFLPGMARGEGLFMAVLRKTDNGECSTAAKRQKRQKQQRKSKATGANVNRGWINSPGDFDFMNVDDAVTAIPKNMAETYAGAAATLRIVHAGVTIGHEKGSNIIPSHSLALSTALCREAFHCVELDYSHAIDYLRREAITLPLHTPRGFVLMTYRGAPIGFAKNIGTRANNMYPQEWRIKSTHTVNEDTIVTW